LYKQFYLAATDINPTTNHYASSLPLIQAKSQQQEENKTKKKRKLSSVQQ
jgi:hypothetical protein